MPDAPHARAAPWALLWRLGGLVTAGALVIVWLLAAVSTLSTIPLIAGLDSSVAVVPGGTLYTLAAGFLSVALTLIALRYVYYYSCWFTSRASFRRPPTPDIAALRTRELPNLKIQVTTKGGALAVVERSLRQLDQICAKHPWLAPSVTAEVITESEVEAHRLSALFTAATLPVTAIQLPPDYQTPNGTQMKARALHYLVERRRAGFNQRTGTTYVVHFDEETLVTEEHLLVLLDYLTTAPHPISQGPILYPLEWERTPWICRALECMRPFGCSECARVMEHPPPPHLHGSNLVIEEAVENEVGWDFGMIQGQPYVAEDLLFGLRAYALLGGQAFGWHGATMLEQPPFSLHWAVQQRLRWVLGALQGLHAIGHEADYAQIPLVKRLRLRVAISMRIATYALGFPLGVAGLYFFLRPTHLAVHWASPLGAWRILIILAGLAWLGSYQIGLARNLRYHHMSWWRRVANHLGILVMTPVVGLCETVGPYAALVRWLAGARRARWTPTPKLPEVRGPYRKPILPQPETEPATVHPQIA